MVKRLRLFAGPNGSGKTTLKNVIDEKLLGVYVNPDDIEKQLKKGIYFNDFKIEVEIDEIYKFFDNSFYKISKGIFSFENNKIKFTEQNSYIASVLSSFIREKLLEKGVSFSFESVASSKDKIEFIKKAKNLGYRIYIYFIATNSPLINISRVKNRVKAKTGHFVPEDKIIKRYYKSIENLKELVKYSNRCYIFDNSNFQKRAFVAEITEGEYMEFKTIEIPEWFYKLFKEFLDE